MESDFDAKVYASIKLVNLAVALPSYYYVSLVQHNKMDTNAVWVSLE